ncbi:MAG: hypothetical protein NT068_00455 [Candidatus Nomurabacteria bacterium]|nr:hypothetical protein [Candidatus Nomurabacteria bacterium]
MDYEDEEVKEGNFGLPDLDEEPDALEVADLDVEDPILGHGFHEEVEE